MTIIPKSRKRPWIKKSSPKKFGAKDIDVNKFYNSHGWRNKIRKPYLLEFPYCVVCAKNNIVSIAKYLDHIIPISNGGAMRDKRNFQGLCKRDHDIKRGKERHGYVAPFIYNEDKDKIPAI